MNGRHAVLAACALLLLARDASAQLTMPVPWNARLAERTALTLVSGAAFSPATERGGAGAGLTMSWALPVGSAGLQAAFSNALTGDVLAGAGGMFALDGERTALELRGGVRTTGEHGLMPTLGATWRTRGGMLAIDANRTPATQAVYRPGVADTSEQGTRILQTPARERRLVADAEIGYRFAFDRFELEAVFGQRLNSDDSTGGWWSRVTTLVAVTPNLALGFAAGTVPVTPWTTGTPARFVSVFTRITQPRRSDGDEDGAQQILSFRVTTDSLTRFVVHAPGARSVEIAGVFSDWQPLALRRFGQALWELSYPIPPGVYPIAVRVDGKAWFAPPGLPVLPDEFGGESAMVEIGAK